MKETNTIMNTFLMESAMTDLTKGGIISLRNAAEALQRNPGLDPVQFLRDMADGMEQG